MATGSTNTASVTTILPASRDTPVSGELASLRQAVVDVCPADATVSFVFTDRLRLTVDVRAAEDLAALEALLPGLAGGVFGSVTRGATPHQSFRRRLTALVDR